MASQGNSGANLTVSLRQLRLVVKDPENGAVVKPFLEMCIGQASMRGHTYAATVLENMRTLLDMHVSNLKRDGTSSAGATRTPAD